MIGRNRSEKIKQVDKICCFVLLTSNYLKKLKIALRLFVSLVENFAILQAGFKTSDFLSETCYLCFIAADSCSKLQNKIKLLPGVMVILPSLRI